jgi:hypothetical protein
MSTLLKRESTERLRHLVEKKLTLGREIDIIGFVDRLLLLASELEGLNCTLRDAEMLYFQAGGEPLCALEVARGRTLLRASCARLSVLCTERTGREVSPYGDTAEFVDEVAPGKRVRFKVHFTNTPDHQELDIQAQPA